VPREEEIFTIRQKQSAFDKLRVFCHV